MERSILKMERSKIACQFAFQFQNGTSIFKVGTQLKMELTKMESTKRNDRTCLFSRPFGSQLPTLLLYHFIFHFFRDTSQIGIPFCIIGMLFWKDLDFAQHLSSTDVM